MRLAPVPIAFSDSLEKGVKFSGLQSLTTHNGLEAAECSRLMGHILIALINRAEGVDGRETIMEVCKNFKSKVQTVEFLARGEC